MRLLAPLALATLLLTGCQHGPRPAVTTTPGAQDLVAIGKKIYLDTPQMASRYVPHSRVTCADCHAGLPLVWAADSYPAYSARAGANITLEQRIAECFERSENGIPPEPGSPEMHAMLAYIIWLGQSHPPRPAVSPPVDLPLASLNRDHGGQLYKEKCASCHGPEGAGQGPFPPLWGDASYNDGAGMGNVYTLAHFIQATMPLGAGHTLSDQEAGDLALFINSQPRPVFAGKAQDFLKSSPPPGSVYYTKASPSRP